MTTMNRYDRSESEEDHEWEPAGRRSKRLKTSHTGEILKPPKLSDRNSALAEALEDIPVTENTDFQELFPKDTYLTARLRYLTNTSERDLYHNKLRALTMSEIHELRVWLESTAAAGRQNWTNGEAILTRRLALRKLGILESATFSYDAIRQPQLRQFPEKPLHSPNPTALYSRPSEETMNSLYSVHITPYKSSFASRLSGQGFESRTNLKHRDWDCETPWMELMQDIRLHYSILHPEDDVLQNQTAPIDYVALQRSHLPQIHDLLSRIFWPGINVSDSLHHSPEKCTIVATYKLLVVGAAFLSSPEETYLTYLVVRPGWENANIATIMLYLLIAANPRKDITLHVSANNPAMMLYNKFGFKAEEFIVGFYEDYLPKESKASFNGTYNTITMISSILRYGSSAVEHVTDSRRLYLLPNRKDS